MTLQEFNTLNTDHKSEHLWEWGYYITSFRTTEKNTVIFSLGSFLAQVNYTLPENTLETITGISSDELTLVQFNLVKRSPFAKLVRQADAGNYFKKLMEK